MPYSYAEISRLVFQLNKQLEKNNLEKTNFTEVLNIYRNNHFLINLDFQTLVEYRIKILNPPLLNNEQVNFLENQNFKDATYLYSENNIKDLSLDYFLENDDILKKLQLNQEKLNALNIIFKNANTLVTARAGTGKSTLLCALVYTLIKKIGVNTNNILLLSFNKAVRQKNEADIKNKDKFDLPDFFGTQTFDSLAFQIVKTPGRVLKTLDQTQLTDAIVDITKKQSLFFRLKYWWYLGELDKEYTIDAKTFTSMLGEGLKSYGEKVIANFLFEHGIEYEYEPVMSWGENQYSPDFLVHQNGLKVVIEYFGLSDKEYLQQVERKREYWNARKDYEFIEMGISDFKGGVNNPSNFLSFFKEKLNNVGIVTFSLSENEKAEKIFNNKISVNKIAEVVLNFINFAQAQCLTPDGILKRLNDKYYQLSLKNKDKFFAEFSVSVYKDFVEYLEINGKYDFFKLKKEAVNIILKSRGDCTLNLGLNKDVVIRIKELEWLLIDEFQDYSPAYHELISAIKEVNKNIKIVCVGDDWQAINGFAGSDVKYINKHETYFPGSARVNLIQNFRSKKDIVDVSNNLMDGFGINASTEDEDDTSCAWVQRIELGKKKNHLKPIDYINAVRGIVSKYENVKITILHRNNQIFGMDLDRFLYETKKGLKVNNHIGISSIHKFKGEESDVVIFINATSFNHPMMHPDRSKHYLLGLTDQKIVDEERRLFYVAVTRAKKALYIITDTDAQSPFIADMGGKS